MTDRSRDLSDTLARLHEALESADALDASRRDELRSAMEEIRAALDSDQEPELHPPLLERLSGLAALLEKEYPALTEAIGRVVSAFGQIGI